MASGKFAGKHLAETERLSPHANLILAPVCILTFGCSSYRTIIRTGGIVTPSLPMYSAFFDWGTSINYTFAREQLSDLKKTSQKHRFSARDHNLAYDYNDVRVIERMWENVKRRFRGGVRNLED